MPLGSPRPRDLPGPAARLGPGSTLRLQPPPGATRLEDLPVLQAGPYYQHTAPPCQPAPRGLVTETENAWNREGRVPRVWSENQTSRKSQSTEAPGALVAWLESCRGGGVLRMGPRQGTPPWAKLPEAFTLLVRHGWQKPSAWRSPCFSPVTTSGQHILPQAVGFPLPTTRNGACPLPDRPADPLWGSLGLL